MFQDEHSDDDGHVADCKQRVKTLVKRILTRMVTDRIFNLTYEAQEQLGCEGCEKDWPSQYDHACLFFGMNPVCCLSDYVDLHYERAAQSVNKTQVILVFGAVTSRLGVGPFSYEGMNMDDIIDHVLNEWKLDPADLSRSFYTNVFDILTELIDDMIQRLNLDLCTIGTLSKTNIAS